MNEIILQEIPEYLINLFDLYNRKCINHKNKYVDHSERIVIPVKDITDEVMMGLDQYERPYIVVKIDDNIHIFYQKYSNREYPWCVYETKYNFGDYLINDKGIITKSNIDNVLNLIEK